MTLPKKCCGKCKWWEKKESGANRRVLSLCNYPLPATVWWEKKESGANLKFCIIMFSDEGKSCPCFTPRK
jgi:hypothetical protein